MVSRFKDAVNRSKRIKWNWQTIKESIADAKPTTPTEWLASLGVFVITLCAGAVVLSIFVFISLWPIGFAWGINNLFGTQIPLNFTTWISIILVTYGLKIIFKGKKND